MPWRTNMQEAVFFHKAPTVEVAFRQNAIDAILSGSEPLPDGLGRTHLLGIDTAGTLAAVCEIVYSEGTAHVRFGTHESYRETDIDESSVSRAMLTARNCGAKKLRFAFPKGDDRIAQIARTNGMCVDRGGEKWSAQIQLPYADGISMSIEYALAFFVPVRAFPA